MNKQSNETYLQFAKRITQELLDKEIDYLKWERLLVGEELYGEENARRCFCFFNRFLDRLNEADFDMIKDEDKLAELIRIRDEIKAEKIKIQTANLEFNANERQVARNAMFQEQILSAIDRLEAIEAKRINVTPSVDASGLLILSDFHAGSTYEFKGLYNEIVAKYDFDIMCERLWRLIGQIEADDMVFDDLTVACLGDFFEGILRMSSLTKLREPVVDTVIRFSEFFANWLVELQNRIQVPINVVTVGGNHDALRLLGQKAEFEGENLGKIVVEFLKLRLAKCKYITIDDYTDVAVKTIRKTNIMFNHGEKDLGTTLEYFSNLYNVDCDMIFAGHLHSLDIKTNGIADVGDKMLIRVGSVCGIDPYAKSIRKGARPSCFFGLFTEDGLGWQKTYYLG